MLSLFGFSVVAPGQQPGILVRVTLTQQANGSLIPQEQQQGTLPSNLLLYSPVNPNGVAIDPTRSLLFFTNFDNDRSASVLYSVPVSFVGPANTATLTVTRLGRLVGAGSNGAFYSGFYWYIPQRTDQLRRVSFDINGRVALDQVFADGISGQSLLLDFGDIDFDSNGLLYLSVSVFGTVGYVQKQLASYNLTTRQYRVLVADAPDGPVVQWLGQIAFGVNNLLFNHHTASGELSILNRSTGIRAAALTSTLSLGDVASSYCGDTRALGTVGTTAIPPITTGPLVTLPTSAPTNRCTRCFAHFPQDDTVGIFAGLSTAASLAPAPGSRPDVAVGTGMALRVLSVRTVLGTSVQYTNVTVDASVDGSMVSRVAAGDVDGDGISEIIVGTARGLYLFSRNAHNTSIWTKKNLSSVPADLAVRLADVNGDMLVDIVSVSTGSPAVRLFINIGASSFNLTVLSLPTGSTIVDVALGDITGDLRPEIVLSVATATASRVTAIQLAFFAGSNRFRSSNTTALFTTPTALPALALADITGDRVDEIVVSTNTSLFWLATGPGTVAFRGTFNVSTSATGVSQLVAADVDGDGFTDVFALSPSLQTLAVFISKPDPVAATNVNFEARLVSSSTRNSVHVLVGDFDADGAVDVGVVRLSSPSSVGELHTHSNKCCVTGPSASALNISVVPCVSDIALTIDARTGSPFIVFNSSGGQWVERTSAAMVNAQFFSNNFSSSEAMSVRFLTQTLSQGDRAYLLSAMSLFSASAYVYMSVGLVG